MPPSSLSFFTDVWPLTWSFLQPSLRELHYPISEATTHIYMEMTSKLVGASNKRVDTLLCCFRSFNQYLSSTTGQALHCQQACAREETEASAHFWEGTGRQIRELDSEEVRG